MEAKVIQQFFPDLISAVAACVQNVSDHCFSKSLIEDTTHTKVLESSDIEKDKARILVRAVRDTIARNPKYFNVFMNVLEKVLSSADDSLLKAMKAAVTSSLSEIEPQILSDSDTSQLQQSISEPSSKGDFIHDRHHDEALEGPEESDSVSVSSTSASDMSKTALESSHDQIADTMITFANESSATQMLGEYQMESNQDVEKLQGTSESDAVSIKGTQTESSTSNSNVNSRDQVIENLKHLMRVDLKQVRKKFLNLQLDVRASLGRTPLKDIIAHVRGYIEVFEDNEVPLLPKETLQEATSTDQFFDDVLQKQWNFLEFDLLITIVERHCDKVTRKKLKQYDDDLKQFFEKRRVSEVSEDLSLSNCIDETKERVIMKLDLSDPTLKEIKELKSKICEILGIMPATLLISEIKQGCVEVIFLIPVHISEYVFGKVITDAQREALKAALVLNFTWRDRVETVAEEEYVHGEPEYHEDTHIFPYLGGSKLLSDMVAVLDGVDWYQLGIHLCVPRAKLKAIDKEHNSTQRQLIEVLSYHQHNEEMSWEKIIDALKKIGGHAKIIIMIESNYITPGQQPSATSNTQLETNDMDVDTVTMSAVTENKGALNEATGNQQVVKEMDIDQTSSDLDGSKKVKIGNEIHSLDVIPAPESQLVADAKDVLLGAVDLKTLVNNLGHAGAFIRIAYNGVTAVGPQYTELQIEIQRLGYDITKLCDESALMVSKFKIASSTVLNKLEATYGYLLLNKENVAIETLSSVSKLAGDMEKAAFALHERVEKQKEKVRNTLKKTQIARGDAAVRIEEKEKEHQQLQIKLHHQQELLDDAKRLESEAEAQRQQIEAKESDAISSIRHIGPFKSLVNALFRYEVFDEGTSTVGLWKEKRIHALEKENMLRKQRYEATETLTSFAVTIQDCTSDQEMAEVAVDALHKTVGALQELIAVVMRAAIFWKHMQEHSRSLADDKMLKMVKMIQDEVTREERKMMWTSAPFKRQAVRFYAGWVALNSLCSEYVEHIKATQKDLYRCIVENPTYEESHKNVGELAKIVLADLENDQKAIAEKEFKAQKEIEALMEE